MATEQQGVKLPPTPEIVPPLMYPRGGKVVGYSNDTAMIMNEVKRRAKLKDPILFRPTMPSHEILDDLRYRKQYHELGNMLVLYMGRRDDITNRVHVGIAECELEGIPYAVVMTYYEGVYYACEREQLTRLYRKAMRIHKQDRKPSPAPVLSREQKEQLWNNTIGYLGSGAIELADKYSGRKRRGVLLTGNPGNGKTMAIKWLQYECTLRNWDFKTVSAPAYMTAKKSDNAEEAIRQLFRLYKRGLIVFDDMDIALRDRDRVNETDDQSIFLTAMDGVDSPEGLVYIFTTNCDLTLIDRAFKRPGRLDVVMEFKLPNTDLRRQLCMTWHEDIRKAINIDKLVADTEGHSFAELDEIKNLLIQCYFSDGVWDVAKAQRLFHENRDHMTSNKEKRRAGFAKA